MALLFQKFEKKETTQYSLAFALIFGRFLGLLPVLGLNEYSNIKLLRVKWKSVHFFHSIFQLTGRVIVAVFGIYDFVVLSEKTFLSFVAPVVFLISLGVNAVFFMLAMSWPQIARRWKSLDKKMINYGFPKNLNKKLKFISLVMFSGTTSEHLLYFLCKIHYMPKSENWNDAIKTYLCFEYSYVFKIINYNIFIGILLQIISTSSIFSWCYTDYFIVIISTSVSARFKQIVESAEVATKSKIKNPVFWAKLREDYNRLSLFCRCIDKKMANVICLSLASNLYITLDQLLFSLSLTRLADPVLHAYFIYSFSFLLFRLGSVLISTAQVDLQSREPGKILHSLPHDVYNIEVDRLLTQIKLDPPALTGREFFRLTNSLLLVVTGAIISYELIVYQFSSVSFKGN